MDERFVKKMREDEKGKNTRPAVQRKDIKSITLLDKVIFTLTYSPRAYCHLHQRESRLHNLLVRWTIFTLIPKKVKTILQRFNKHFKNILLRVRIYIVVIISLIRVNVC